MTTSPHTPGDASLPQASLGGAERLTEELNPSRELLKSLVMPVILIAFATYLLVGIGTMNVPEGSDFPGPRFFPGLVVAVIYLLSLMLVIASLREHRARLTGRHSQPEAAEDDENLPMDWHSFAWVVGGFLGFALLLDVLGWVIGAGLLFWCVAWGFGSRHALKNLVIGLSVSSIAYIGFDMALGLTLPSGVLGWGF